MKSADVIAILFGLGGVIAALVVIVRGTRRRDAMGINFKSIQCPKCGTPVPLVRAPSSFRQAMWGGCSCRKCGTEIDKWGRDVGRR